MRTLFLALALALPLAAAAEPYTFKVIKVRECTDGDTCRVDLDDAHPIFNRVTWRNQPVRLLGVDAPELHPARCPQEKEQGEKARARILELLTTATTVELRMDADRGRDKFGRLLGTLLADGKDVAAILVAEGLAHPYAGRGRRRGWC